MIEGASKAFDNLDEGVVLDYSLGCLFLLDADLDQCVVSEQPVESLRGPMQCGTAFNTSHDRCAVCIRVSCLDDGRDETFLIVVDECLADWPCLIQEAIEPAP